MLTYNAVLGFTQEQRAEWSLDALNAMFVLSGLLGDIFDS